MVCRLYCFAFAASRAEAVETNTCCMRRHGAQSPSHTIRPSNKRPRELRGVWRVVCGVRCVVCGTAVWGKEGFPTSPGRSPVVRSADQAALLLSVTAPQLRSSKMQEFDVVPAAGGGRM
jgi:hypothetical protein